VGTPIVIRFREKGEEHTDKRSMRSRIKDKINEVEIPRSKNPENIDYIDTEEFDSIR
jgi:hypothetical protein